MCVSTTVCVVWRGMTEQRQRVKTNARRRFVYPHTVSSSVSVCAQERCRHGNRQPEMVWAHAQPQAWAKSCIYRFCSILLQLWRHNWENVKKYCVKFCLLQTHVPFSVDALKNPHECQTKKCFLQYFTTGMEGMTAGSNECTSAVRDKHIENLLANTFVHSSTNE